MSDEEHTAPPEGEEQASGLPPRTDMTFVYAVLGVAAVILLSLAVYKLVVSWRRNKTLHAMPSAMEAAGIKSSFETEFPMRAEYERIKDNSADEQTLLRTLMARAMATVPHIKTVQTEGQHLEQAHRRGKLLPGIMGDFSAAVAALNQEIGLIQGEANTLKPGFGEQIIPLALQQFQRETQRRILQKRHQMEMQRRQALRQRGRPSNAPNNRASKPAGKSAPVATTVEEVTDDAKKEQ